MNGTTGPSPARPGPREVSERYWTAEAARDLDGIMACFHDDAVFRTPRQTWRGSEEIRDRYARMADQYPELSVDVGWALCSDDRGALEWHAVLTDPQGLTTRLSGVNLVTVVDGRFSEIVCHYDPTA